MKIIIVGAGIAGLTLAAACQRIGFQVKVYDKSRELRHIGGGLLLWPHSLRYLEWLGLSNCLKSFHVQVKRCRMVDGQGSTFFCEETNELYSLLSGEILPIDRSDLQQALAAQLQANTLKLGKECIEIKNEPDQTKVIFADGTEETADIIIGADGINSVVRKSLNKNAELQYTNHCWWGGIIEQKYAPNLSPDEVFTVVGLGKMCIVWPTQGDRFMWYLPVKMPVNDLVPGEGGLSQLQKICADWNDDVQKIISAPTCAQRFHLPIYTMPPESHWATSSIALIGDAAHALGPILGQGVSQAMEDVFVLVNLLKNKPTNVADALKRYETLRFHKTQRLFELENQSAATMINDDNEALAAFQQQIKHLNLAAIYQDLLPLVDEKACLELASAVNASYINKIDGSFSPALTSEFAAASTN